MKLLSNYHNTILKAITDNITNPLILKASTHHHECTGESIGNIFIFQATKVHQHHWDNLILTITKFLHNLESQPNVKEVCHEIYQIPNKSRYPQYMVDIDIILKP